MTYPTGSMTYPTGSMQCPRCMKHVDPLYTFTKTGKTCDDCMTDTEFKIMKQERAQALADLWAQHEPSSLEATSQ